MESLTDDEQEIWKSSGGLFSILNMKFKPWHNKIILMQHRKLCRAENESAEEWMGLFRTKANECNYKECDRQLKEQFRKGINDEKMTTKC